MNELQSPKYLSNRTTPTWEVELLISGVAVFAMLQLPGWLDDRMFALEPQLSDDWRIVVVLSYIYSKSAAVVLAVTFTMHLLLRAQWIALVGMHSVYPKGVLLERLRMGPIQRAIETVQQDSTGEAIERADNRASVVFAIGVNVAFTIIAVCVMFCGSVLLAMLISQAIGWRVDPTFMISLVFTVVMLPLFTASTLDQSMGNRLRPGGLLHRGTHALLRFYTRIGMGRSNNRIIAILSSNGGERRILALVFGAMTAALIFVGWSYWAMRTSSATGNYSQFPDSDALRIDSAHYDDQRNPARHNAVPFVQSSVVQGPYLRLVVPFRPNRDMPAMRKHCAPMIGPEDDALAIAKLACLQSLHAVTLDGKPLDRLAYEIANDPSTQRPALLAMIDVRDLPRGRHELRVAHPPRANRKPDKDNPDPGFTRIPFWR